MRPFESISNRNDSLELDFGVKNHFYVCSYFRQFYSSGLPLFDILWSFLYLVLYFLIALDQISNHMRLGQSSGNFGKTFFCFIKLPKVDFLKSAINLLPVFMVPNYTSLPMLQCLLGYGSASCNASNWRASFSGYSGSV